MPMLFGQRVHGASFFIEMQPPMTVARRPWAMDTCFSLSIQPFAHATLHVLDQLSGVYACIEYFNPLPLDLRHWGFRQAFPMNP